MQFNRLIYDKCAYKQEIDQSVSPLAFQLDTSKYVHEHECRPEFGILGGTAVSRPKGNMVDLENDLSGRNRPNTHCPEYKYMPNHDRKYVQGKEYIKPVCHPKVDTRMEHLQACNFNSYPPLPSEPALRTIGCPANPPKKYVR